MERDDWVNPEPQTYAPEHVLSGENVPAPAVVERDDSQPSGPSTTAPDQDYPTVTPAPRPEGEWRTVETWVRDERPSAASDCDYPAIVPAARSIERRPSKSRNTLAPEGLIVSAEIEPAPRVVERDRPRRHAPGTLAPEHPRA